MYNTELCFSQRDGQKNFYPSAQGPRFDPPPRLEIDESRRGATWPVSDMINEAPRREGRRGANERLLGWGAWLGARRGLNERETYLFRWARRLVIRFAGLGSAEVGRASGLRACSVIGLEHEGPRSRTVFSLRVKRPCVPERREPCPPCRKSLRRDVADGRGGRNGSLGALADADQNAIVEQRRISARDTRPNARNVRNDERPARIIPRQQGHTADRVRGHHPDGARTGLAYNRLAVSEVGRFDEGRHRRAIGAYGVWRE
jgi:hypothetical protein